ncbi:nitrogen regulatory IIA protein [Caballeronia terrestris]|uniref:Nitrogen regulatory IIA protein n=1 Tax=Caballeronia terrestris TaxID=1226301 RepID=A0A158KL89_9BURK|nr:PTS sugar transporter subunit IIA [Caballeronia terrestris]SAL81503.1 nitrogen regulatory IIA protein [Caballeronia terrestris]
MHVTLDAQHVTPLREALIRDCGDRQWTIRVAPLGRTGRVRLSLYLPKDEVSHAIHRVTLLSPTAEVGRMLEISESPTDAWHTLMRGEPSQRDHVAAHDDDTPIEKQTIGALLSETHVLLGLNAAHREELFVRLGGFFERDCGRPAAVVTAALGAREALGSTGLGQGVAVPHGHLQFLSQPQVAYVRPVSPISFDAPDGQPVSDIVVLLVPDWADSTHLHLLADVAQRFCDHHFREELHACGDAHAVCQLFTAFDVPERRARKD